MQHVLNATCVVYLRIQEKKEVHVVLMCENCSTYMHQTFDEYAYQRMLFDNGALPNKEVEDMLCLELSSYLQRQSPCKKR